MSSIFFRMLPDKVHLFIESLDTCHVGFCIIGKFDLLAAAYALRAPVEISHVYRTSYLACYCVESCLPAFYGFSCSLRCKSEVYDFLSLHFLDDAQNDVTAFLPVDRNAAKLAEEPS